jgi:hypothetical protein
VDGIGVPLDFAVGVIYPMGEVSVIAMGGSMDDESRPVSRLPSLPVRLLISAAALVQIAVLLAICWNGLST